VSRQTTSRDRYGEPTFRRTALAPGILAALALLGGIALLGEPAFLVFRFIAAIFAAIVGWYAIQARHWWWLPPLAAIVVVWNPVVPFDLSGQLWLAAQFAAALVFVAAGVLIRVPNPDAGRATAARRGGR
jgi:hypothetical protein